MGENENLKKGKREFTLRCLRLVKTLPNNFSSNSIQELLIRSSTSAAEDFRASQLAQSRITARKKSQMPLTFYLTLLLFFL